MGGIPKMKPGQVTRKVYDKWKIALPSGIVTTSFRDAA